MTETTTALVPVGERVLLRRIDISTSRGFRVPQNAEAQEVTASQYEVVALPDVKTARHSIGATCLYSLRVGDTIYLAMHKAWKIETDGEELYAAEAADILAVAITVRSSEETV